MKITPLETQHVEQAAEMFCEKLRGLRADVAALPEGLDDPQRWLPKLANRAESAAGLAAVENGRLLGYLSWYIVEEFRDTQRTGAYCPEWGHGALGENAGRIYRGLYRAAAERWQACGCGVHAITLLAHEREAQTVWFWNGFGLAVVDALRWNTPLEVDFPRGLELRRAVLSDAPLLEQIEAEHWQHYSAPPVQMYAGSANSEAEFRALLGSDDFHAWLALDGEQPAAYLRLESRSHGAASIVDVDDTIAITGAFTRPAYRGRRAMPALLSAAIKDTHERGFQRMSVDFESFNPEAAVFWPRYFAPVCYSVMRIPERSERSEHSVPGKI